jgi:hypothetical protein
MGELKEYFNSNNNKIQIPNEWKGRYNVRWQGKVNVKPFDPNVTKVRFSRAPKIDVKEEIIKKTKLIQTKLNWPQIPTHWTTQGVDQDGNDGYLNYSTYNVTVVPTLNFRRKLVSQFPTNESPTSIVTITNPWLNITNGAPFYMNQNASASFNASMLGATVIYGIGPDIIAHGVNYEAALPGLNLSGYSTWGDYYNKFMRYDTVPQNWEGFQPQSYVVPPSVTWTGTILEILSPTSVKISGVPNTKTTTTISQTLVKTLNGTYAPFSFPIVTQLQTYVYSTYVSSSIVQTPESQSLATISLRDIDTFTGDATRLKLYYSSRSDNQNYKLLEDIQIESNELLITSSFQNLLNVRTGLLNDQTYIDQFWATQSLYTTVIATYEDTIAFDSVKLQPASSVQDKKSTNSALYRFYNKEPLSFSVNSYYQLDFNATLSGSTYNYGKLEVYMSGSAFLSSSISPYGKFIGYIETDKQYKIFDKQQYTFKPDKAATGSASTFGNVVFVGKNGGTFYLHDISLRAIAETGFTPNDVTIRTVVPLSHNSESLDIKCELYDVNNNLIPINVNKSFTFGGGNSVGQSTTINILNASQNSSVITTGTNPISTDNIQLVGTGGTSYLSLGQTSGTGYNTTGIFLGNTSTNVNQLSLVSANDYLLWDGTYLSLETKSLIATDISNVVFKNGLFLTGSATRPALDISGSDIGARITGSLLVSGSSEFRSDVTIGNSKALKLTGTSDCNIEIGYGRADNGYSYIDLIGDATYTDYGLRMIRNNGGANTTSQILHRGTGNFTISTNEAAAITFNTTNTERMRIKATGEVGIGVTPTWTFDVNGTSATKGTVKAITTKSSNFTAGLTDDTFLCNTTSGNITATLPQASTATGLVLTFKKTSTSNSLTLDGYLLEAIDGVTTYSVGGPGTKNSVTIQCDGGNWYIISYFSG